VEKTDNGFSIDLKLTDKQKTSFVVACIKNVYFSMPVPTKMLLEKLIYALESQGNN
jgi:hypothetical protein